MLGASSPTIPIIVTDAPAPFVLASGSPRRAELLARAGLHFEIRATDVDESAHPGETPAALVRRLARSKARAGVAHAAGRPVLGADTIVVLDGELLGKPGDEREARSMLGRLAGREHTVITAVAVAQGERLDDRIVVTAVTMRAIDEEEITRYCASEEPYDKAGGYGIQGRAAAFISRVDGSYTGVMGLPMFETLSLLAGAGVRP